MQNTYQDAPTGGIAEARDRRALELAADIAALPSPAPAMSEEGGAYCAEEAA
jgi:hypothetical protein